MWKVLKQDKTALAGFVILGIIAVAVLAPVISPYGFPSSTFWTASRGPARIIWLGTDEFGRDLLTRIIWGARPALLVGVLSVLVSIGIGVPIGFMAGYKMGWLDRVVSWWVDVALSFPSILLGLMIVILLGPGWST
jgi:peptide/nickel transport system permease protein